jgi:hypothetical protein
MRPLLVLVLLSGVAAAHPPPPPPDEPLDWREEPALLQWSSWVRAGWGFESTPPGYLARSIEPPAADVHTTWQAALGADVSVRVAGRLRIGPWIELAGTEPAIGGELVVTGAPSHFDRFFYDGEGVLALRAGATSTSTVAAVAWGYRCPWRLWGPYSRTSRYEIGARFVISASRAYADPSSWTATVGLEVEPIGAIRYLLGIRSWY